MKSIVLGNGKAELHQLKSVELFAGEKFSGLTNVYNAFKISTLIRNNRFAKIDELQKVLIPEDISQSEIEDQILLNICEMVKKDRKSRMSDLFLRTIKGTHPELVEGLYKDNKLIRVSLDYTLESLHAELHDSQFPLSDAGKKRIGGFHEYFTKLKESLDQDITRKIDLSHAHKLELRKHLILEYVRTADFGFLKEVLLKNPAIEGIQQRELLASSLSSMKIDESQQNACIFYLGMDFSLSNVLVTYPFELLYDKSKEMMLGLGHFLSVVATKELDLILFRYIWEISLGLRPYLILICRRQYDSTKYVTVVIRKKHEKTNEMEVVCVDAENVKMIDPEDEKLHTSLLYKLINSVQTITSDMISRNFEYFNNPSFLSDMKTEHEVEAESEGEEEEEEEKKKEEERISMNIDDMKEKIIRCVVENNNDPTIFSSRKKVHVFLEQWKRFHEEGSIKKTVTEEINQQWDEKTAFFVYGTLRPDADRSVHWCKWWNEKQGDKLRNRKGYIKNSDLYLGKYPFVLLNNKKKKKEEKWNDHVAFGWIQDFDPEIELEKYKKKLSDLDRVEGCPNFYKRKIVKGFVCEEFDKSKVSGKEEEVLVHVYYLESDVFGNSKLIESGDFMNQK